MHPITGAALAELETSLSKAAEAVDQHRSRAPFCPRQSSRSFRSEADQVQPTMLHVCLIKLGILPSAAIPVVRHHASRSGR